MHIVLKHGLHGDLI